METNAPSCLQDVVGLIQKMVTSREGLKKKIVFLFFYFLDGSNPATSSCTLVVKAAEEAG